MDNPSVPRESVVVLLHQGGMVRLSLGVGNGIGKHGTDHTQVVSDVVHTEEVPGGTGEEKPFGCWMAAPTPMHPSSAVRVRWERE